MPALDGYIGPSRNAREKVQSGTAEPLGTIPDCIKLIQNGYALAVCVEHITSEGAADLRLRLGARNLLRALLDYALMWLHARPVIIVECSHQLRSVHSLGQRVGQHDVRVYPFDHVCCILRNHIAE
jgi:hypothetical protein